MEYIAHARYQRISPRKVAQILNVIRGKSVEEAYNKLYFVTKSAKPVILKTLQSAVANFGKDADLKRLKIKQVWVNEAPRMKRIRAAAMGRAFTYRHRISHLTVIVSD